MFSRKMARTMTVVLVGLGAVTALADTFGTGANQFTMDFVTIVGDASAANGTNISQWSAGHQWYREFADPADDFRIAMYEVTNDQWNKFVASLGVPVTGGDEGGDGYDQDPYWTDPYYPTQYVSWYEAAQFVNWLNTSHGYQPAYKFTGTQGTASYFLEVWSPAEAAGGTNLYRHKDAMYFLPTEDEWVKSAYWNGSAIQTWATVGNVFPSSSDSRFGDSLGEPWYVGSGIQELNGTYDMMGNVWELVESELESPDYEVSANRAARGGYYGSAGSNLGSALRGAVGPAVESGWFGIRVASKLRTDVRPKPVQVYSWKTHAGRGTFGVNSGRSETECRSNGPSKVEVTFDIPVARLFNELYDVSVQYATVTSVKQTGPTTLEIGLSDVTGSTVMIGFPGVGSVDDPMMLSVQGSAYVPVCIGDVNDDGIVNIFDLLDVRNAMLQQVTWHSFRYDLYVGGTIDIFDLLTVRNHLMPS